MKRFVKVFRALGEPTRQRMIKLLSSRDLYVCELAEVLDMKQSRVSQHLRILKEAGVVREGREGTWTRYSLDRALLKEAWGDYLSFLQSPLETLEGFGPEAARLKTLQLGPTLAVCKVKPGAKKGRG